MNNTTRTAFNRNHTTGNSENNDQKKATLYSSIIGASVIVVLIAVVVFAVMWSLRYSQKITSNTRFRFRHGRESRVDLKRDFGSATESTTNKYVSPPVSTQSQSLYLSAIHCPTIDVSHVGSMPGNKVMEHEKILRRWSTGESRPRKHSRMNDLRNRNSLARSWDNNPEKDESIYIPSQVEREKSVAEQTDIPHRDKLPKRKVSLKKRLSEKSMHLLRILKGRALSVSKSNIPINEIVGDEENSVTQTPSYTNSFHSLSPNYSPWPTPTRGRSVGADYPESRDKVGQGLRQHSLSPNDSPCHSPRRRRSIGIDHSEFRDQVRHGLRKESPTLWARNYIEEVSSPEYDPVALPRSHRARARRQRMREFAERRASAQTSSPFVPRTSIICDNN